jgi:hypothetical protein
MTSSREARTEAADALCEILREYIVEHGCEVELVISEVPDKVWEEQTARIMSDHRKRELIQLDRQAGRHVITYWKEGA